MFTAPETRLCVSNKALVTSESFLVPVTLRSEAKSSEAAFEGLRRAFEDTTGFVPGLTGIAPGAILISFDEAVSPRVSRVDLTFNGKEHRFDLTFAFKFPLPVEKGFWDRVRFISTVYDRLAQLGSIFEDRRGIRMDLEGARLDQEKEDPERMRVFRK